MKKYLLGTTALATAGLIAGMAGSASAANEGDNRIKVGVHGYHQQWGVYADQDIDTGGFRNDTSRTATGNVVTTGTTPSKIKTNAVDQKHNSEICFVGETTLDNGITFGINVQLEANTSADQIDESYLYVQSDSMGKLILGDENNAGYLLHVTAPDGGISIDSGDMISDDFWASTYGGSSFNTTLATTNLRFNDNDSGKFTYISPRFAGFQLGASYIPQFEPGGGDDNSSIYKQRGVVTGTDRDTQRNGVAVGANFSEDFNGLGVQVSLGWLGADTSDNPLSAANAGAQLSFAGFSVGGAYSEAFGGSRTVNSSGQETSEFDGYGWTAGGAYEIGPYKIGITYQRGVNDGSSGVNKDVRLDQANISGTYQFGPGVRLVGGFFGYNSDAQQPGTTGYNNDGWGFATGIKLGF